MRSTTLLSVSAETSKRYKKLRALLKNIIEPHTVQLLDEQIDNFHDLFFNHQLTGRQVKYILSDLKSSLSLIDLYSQLRDFCQTQDNAFRNTEEYQHCEKLNKIASQLITKTAEINQEKMRLTSLLEAIADIINTPPDRRTEADLKLLEIIKNSRDEKLLDDITAFPDNMAEEIKAIETRSKEIKCAWQTMAKKIFESKALLFHPHELQEFTDLEIDAEKFKEATAGARKLLPLHDLITLKQDFYHWIETTQSKKIRTMRTLFNLLTNIDGCVFDQCHENSTSKEKLVKLIGDHDKLIPTSLNVTPLIAKIASVIRAYDIFKSEYKEIKAQVKYIEENHQHPDNPTAVVDNQQTTSLPLSTKKNVAELIKLFDKASASIKPAFSVKKSPKHSRKSSTFEDAQLETFNRPVELVHRKNSTPTTKERNEPSIQYKRENFHRRTTDAHMPKLLGKLDQPPKKSIRAEAFFMEIFKNPTGTPPSTSMIEENENNEKCDESKTMKSIAMI